jgi:ubiquinone/menaquinone biosynthesis C-methylase UbiE
MRGPDAERKRDGSRSSLVWDVLAQAIAERVAATGRTALDIVDVGAGTGGFAVSIASRGHRVTVVDPSPDALAAARWRAAEAGVTLVDVQGEAGDLPALVGAPAAGGAGADLVICHSVLEYVDSPAAALAAVARVLRPGGTVSVLAANSVAAVLQRALAGKYAEARALLPGAATGAASGSAAAPGSGSGQRRFTLPELTALLEEAGLRPGDAHGIRIFASLLPGAGADPAAAEALRELEQAAASLPPLRDIATRLHVLAYRPLCPVTTRAAASCTSTWTPSTRAWSSATGPSCGAGRWWSAGSAAGAWSFPRPTRPARSASGARCRSAGRGGCARRPSSSRPGTTFTARCPGKSWPSSGPSPLR